MTPGNAGFGKAPDAGVPADAILLVNATDPTQEGKGIRLVNATDPTQEGAFIILTNRT